MLEAESSGQHHTSARNSQVIHAGISYPRGLLKAKLCVQGSKQLYDFCKTRHISHAHCEKLVIATDAEQLDGLQSLCDRGHLNGVDDLRVLSAADAMALEPDLQCHGAVLSPSTGVVDALAFMMALLGEAGASGAMFAYHARLAFARVLENGFALIIDDADRTTMTCSNLINAAGLGAWDLARHTAGYDRAKVPPQSFVKAGYFSLKSGKSSFERLIYPSPNAVYPYRRRSKNGAVQSTGYFNIILITDRNRSARCALL